MLNTKKYLQVTGLLFLVIGAVHAARLVYAWPAQIGTAVIPMWVSWVAVFLAAYLSWHAFRLQRR